MPQKNLALEALRKLLGDEIRSRSRSNLIEARKFSERLEEAIGCVAGLVDGASGAMHAEQANDSPFCRRKWGFMWLSRLLAVFFALVPVAAPAHPHVFVDAG